jgi:hypothetical protein
MEALMSVSDVQEEEIVALKNLLDERRESGVKGAYPAPLRGRIVRLWRGGVSTRILSERLGISTSMLYGWCRKEKAPKTRQDPAVDVLQVASAAVTPSLSASGELRLQLGAFSVVVSMAGA